MVHENIISIANCLIDKMFVSVGGHSLTTGKKDEREREEDR